MLGDDHYWSGGGPEERRSTNLPWYLAQVGIFIKKIFLEKGLQNFFFLDFLRPHPQIISGRPLMLACTLLCNSLNRASPRWFDIVFISVEHSSKILTSSQWFPWARMKFKPRKSRSLVLEGGKVSMLDHVILPMKCARVWQNAEVVSRITLLYRKNFGRVSYSPRKKHFPISNQFSGWTRETLTSSVHLHVFAPLNVDWTFLKKVIFCCVILGPKQVQEFLIRELSFFTGRGGPSVCDGRSPIFSGPPLCLRRKILVPPFAYGEKFWSPPLTSWKNFGPPLPKVK